MCELVLFMKVLYFVSISVVMQFVLNVSEQNALVNNITYSFKSKP